MPTITATVQIHPSPEEIANAFCDMNGEEQADFFNAIYTETLGWKYPVEKQMQAITDAKNLDNGGRSIMRVIGAYSSKAF